jgi:hypothetical protein
LFAHHFSGIRRSPSGLFRIARNPCEPLMVLGLDAALSLDAMGTASKIVANATNLIVACFHLHKEYGGP